MNTQPKNPITAGDYTVLATVFNPVADECGSDEDVELDFNISDPPVSKFNFSGVCLGDTTFFRDASITNGREIKTWLWDFGDGYYRRSTKPITFVYKRPGIIK
jgi:PKD repeat protein